MSHTRSDYRARATLWIPLEDEQREDGGKNIQALEGEEDEGGETDAEKQWGKIWR